MAIMRDDGSTDWRTLGRWLSRSILVLWITVILYLAGAWVIVMNTSWCPGPWMRLDDTDGTCVSPK